MQLPVPVNLFVSEGGHIRAFELVDVVEDGNSLGGKTFIYYEGELDAEPVAEDSRARTGADAEEAA
jgi:hypothetical protein